jgi:hypothetical protein
LPSGGHGLKQGDLVGLRPDAARAVLFGKQGQAIRLQ